MGIDGDNTSFRPAQTAREILVALDALSLTDLSEVEKDVILKSLAHVQESTGEVSLSVETLHTATKWSVRHIQRALASLDSRGILKVTHRGGGRPHGTHRSRGSVRTFCLPRVDRRKLAPSIEGASIEKANGASYRELAPSIEGASIQKLAPSRLSPKRMVSGVVLENSARAPTNQSGTDRNLLRSALSAAGVADRFIPDLLESPGWSVGALEDLVKSIEHRKDIKNIGAYVRGAILKGPPMAACRRARQTSDAEDLIDREMQASPQFTAKQIEEMLDEGRPQTPYRGPSIVGPEREDR